MKYKVNDEGVKALNAVATGITAAVDQIAGLISNLQSTADEHNDTIGPHKASLDEALENINANINQATEPVTEIAKKLNEVAESYQDIIENDPFFIEASSDTPKGSQASSASSSATGNSVRSRTKKINPIRVAIPAIYMGAAIKAQDAGYQTVRGYMAGVVGGVVGGLLVKLAEKISNAPKRSLDELVDSVKKASSHISHIYDLMWASEHPENVLDFTPSPVPQEIVDKNTLILDEDPYDAAEKIGGFETETDENGIPTGVVIFTDRASSSDDSIDTE